MLLHNILFLLITTIIQPMFADYRAHFRKRASEDGLVLPKNRTDCLCFIAARYGYYDLACYLVARELDFSTINYNRTTLTAPLSPNSRNQFGESALHIACQNGNIDIGRLLLHCGANPNLKNRSGSQPLLTAVLNNNTNLVRLLLCHGANPNIKNQASKTPLSIAILNDNADIQSLLLACGAQE